jgi:hypothetical protein
MWLLTHRCRSFSDDWDTHASADIRQLFLDPKASKAMVKDAYLVQQANIYVTQVSDVRIHFPGRSQRRREQHKDRSTEQCVPRSVPCPWGFPTNSTRIHRVQRSRCTRHATAKNR